MTGLGGRRLDREFHRCAGAKLHFRSEGKGEALLFPMASGLCPAGPRLWKCSRGASKCWRPTIRASANPNSPDWIDDVPDLAFFYLDNARCAGRWRVHVVGHSLGGWIALEMAIRSTRG